MARKGSVLMEFGLIACSRCKTPRVRNVICPDCGQRPKGWETNDAVLRRRAAVAAIRAAMPPGSPSNRAADSQDQSIANGDLPLLSPADLFARLGSWLGRFLLGLGEASNDGFRDVQALSGAVRELFELQSQAERFSNTRPMARLVVIANEVMVDLRAMVEGFLTAMEADHPLAAQQSTAKAQEKIDAAAAGAADLAAWLERCEAVLSSDSAGMAFGLMLADTMKVAGVSTIVELDTAARMELDNLLALSVEPGTGVLYAIQANYADLFLSREAFVSKFKAALQIYLPSEQTMRKLLGNQHFCHDLARLERELLDEGAATQHAILNATVERQAIRAAISLHSTLVEIAGRLLCAPLLLAAGYKTRSYSRMRHDNATDLLGSARAHQELAVLLSGLNSDLRTAAAHLGVIHSGDGPIRTELSRGSTAFDAEQVVDLTFEALESVLAGITAIRTLGGALGLPINDNGGSLRDLGLSDAGIVSLVLRGFNHDAEVLLSTDPTELLIAKLSGGLSGLSAAIGAAMMQVGGHTYDRITLVHGDQRWTCPVRLYEAFRNAPDEFERQLALIRIQRGWESSEGARWLSDNMLHRWVAGAVVEATTEPLPSRIQRLRRIREVANDLGGTLLVPGISTAISMARLEGTGHRMGVDEFAELEHLITPPATDDELDLI